ncbi:hypothetical protein CMI40_00670 [Candidatus Pacearchaeota archaeon]|jgi:hypothetical protein|nr:hypothetical protein [Candidatus Pacearchaeota archaeon]|tara:strand:- start:7176 stop:7427 length:252 start_codon:yes stop_codon:yes gene_type:complete
MTTTKRIIGISGRSVELTKYNKGLKLFMKDSEEKSISINLDPVHLSKESDGAGITILGTDFLKQNNLTLVYNPNGDSYLENNK